MALLNSHSASNLVIEQGLTVWNSNRLIHGNWTWESISMSGSFASMWEAHRYAKQSFRYVGMTKAAADACATAMKTAYTRAIRSTRWNGAVNEGEWVRESGGTVVMAEITPTQNPDGSYDVVVNVNEDDVNMGKTAAEAMSFANEDARTYVG